jgi:hypothetical protein
MAAMKAWPSQGEVTTMRDPGHAPIQAGPRRRWIRTVRAYLHEPAVLTIIAVAFFISAAGQAVVLAYLHDDSVVTTTVLSVFGSLFLAAAIIIAARRHDQAAKNRRPSGRDAH